MYVKITKTKYKRKVYRYVKIIQAIGWSYRQPQEKVIATLGTVKEVKPYVETLRKGLKKVLDID